MFFEYLFQLKQLSLERVDISTTGQCTSAGSLTTWKELPKKYLKLEFKRCFWKMEIPRGTYCREFKNFNAFRNASCGKQFIITVKLYAENKTANIWNIRLTSFWSKIWNTKQVHKKESSKSDNGNSLSKKMFPTISHRWNCFPRHNPYCIKRSITNKRIWSTGTLIKFHK